MAHNVEPMDIDSDFENKENSIHHSNVYPRTPCTDKGYEELDVSELNMKLRYSATPTSSPMSKSYTANCMDNKHFESGDDNLNGNLTRSFNSNLTKTDIGNKSLKSLPLQPICADQLLDNNRSTSVLRHLESTNVVNDITVTVTNDNNGNIAISSLSSSISHTPEITTPTKEITRNEGGSPIMRGLKSVLNMFRSSQSPIPPSECDDGGTKQILSPVDITNSVNSGVQHSQAVLASTPIATHRHKDSPSKRNSPLKDSIVFRDDLEKELLWKDETTVLFSEEKIPIHKLFYQQPKVTESDVEKPDLEDNLNATVEYMDISCSDSYVAEKSLTYIQSERQPIIAESDGEFVDCETTFHEDKCEILDSAKIEITKLNISPPKQYLEQDGKTTEYNGEINLTVSQHVTYNMEMSHSEKVLNDTILKLADSKQVPLEINGPLESATIVVSPETTPAIDITLKDEGMIAIPSDENIKNLEHSKILKVVEQKLASDITINIPTASLENKDIVSKSLLQTKINNTQEHTLHESELENVVNTPHAIEKPHDFQYSESSHLKPQFIQDQNIQIVPVTLDKTIDKNVSENTLFSMEEINTHESEIMKNTVHTEENTILPENIPLPDEDFPELNIKSDEESKLESAAHVDILPIDPMLLAKQNVNKVVGVSSATDLAPGIIYNQDSESLGQSLSTHESEHCRSKDIDNLRKDELKTGLKSEIDKIVHDAKTIIENQQNNSTVFNEYCEIKETDAVFNNKNITFSQNNSNELNQSLGTNKNEVVLDVSQHLKYLSEDKIPMFSNEHIDTKLIITNAQQSSSEDFEAKLGPVIQETKILSSQELIGTDNNSLHALNENISNITVSAGTDICLKEHTKDIVMTSYVGKHQNINADLFVSNEYPVIHETKTGLPDVISDTIEYNTHDKSSIEPKEENVRDGRSDEISRCEEMVPKKNIIHEMIDEEVILSENNSPFVSIASECLQAKEQTLNVDESETNVTKSPPTSPKITSKGYNFNFEEIDDPFATKTKIRLSPPLNSPAVKVNETLNASTPKKDSVKNRRKSQYKQKNPAIQKDITFKDIANKTLATPTYKDNNKQVDSAQKLAVVSESKIKKQCDSEIQNDMLIIKPDNLKNSENNEVAKDIDKGSENQTENNAVYLAQSVIDKISEITNENKSSMESLVSSNEVKNTSSSEQSTYYSAEASVESAKNRNVFNIPEIDDVNFNPFISKSKVCASPPPSNNDNNYISETHLDDKITDTIEEKEYGNISNVTCSSKTTDEKDITVKEVHTEDEDTIEGPFLEAEDFNNVDKISDIDDEHDMMQFSELPTQSNEEQIEGGEMFIDAEAFEFLLNQNKSSVVADSGKESLFLKFDPLFAKRISTDGVLAALNKVQKRQNTPKKVSVAQQLDVTFEKPIPGPSNLDLTQKPNMNDSVGDSTDELNVTVTKPMMVVTPAVNPVITPRNKATTPTSSNRRSITFTSPAIAVIDRLLSMSANNSLLGLDSTMTQVSREQNEADHALTQLRELLAEKEINVYNLRSECKELKDRLVTMEAQVRSLEAESEKRLKQINELNEKLSEKTKLNKSMAVVVEEYERTIASLIAESEQDKKRHEEERSKLMKERDEQTAHLASMEVSFSDLHSKYEKSKQIILTCKANEDAYKKTISEFEASVSKMQSNYELLKQHATFKLNHANQELEKMNRAHEAEVLKLNAMIKRKELHITSLEETLTQKTKANEELTAICDELINKVG